MNGASAVSNSANEGATLNSAIVPLSGSNRFNP